MRSFSRFYVRGCSYIWACACDLFLLLSLNKQILNYSCFPVVFFNADATLTNVSSNEDVEIANQTFDGTPGLDNISTTTDEWRSSSADGSVSHSGENTTTTAESLPNTNNRYPSPNGFLPPWLLVNDSIAKHALEEYIEKYKNKMVRPGKELTVN